MLRLPPFRYHVATSISEAADILAHEADVRLVAGGTDLWPNMKRRQQRAETVLSLMRLPDLRGVSVDGDLRIGATTTLREVAEHADVRSRFPAFARAVASISTPHLRNTATLGGNLFVDTRCTYYDQTEHWRESIDFCMKEQGSVCWVAPSSPRCWAHSATDAAPALIALGARIRLVSTEGERTLPVEDLYREDGIAHLTARGDEILAEILIPGDADAESCHSSFHKLRRRGAIDFAVLSVAASVWTDRHGVVTRARIVLGSVASRPVLAEESAAGLIGEPLGEETIARAARRARKLATPMDNSDFDTAWRGKMVETYTRAALREIAGSDTGLRIL